MPTRELNYTGRKRIARSHVSIVLDDEAVPLVFEIKELELQNLSLPDDALVRVEAYRQSLYAPTELGTVSDMSLGGARHLRDFDSPDGILFRVKVTSVTQATEGQLLAELDRIRPVRTSGRPESLLHVRPDGELGQEVFKLSWEPGPVLLINDGIDLWRDTAVNPRFASLVLPSVLRSILTKSLQGQEPDEDAPDEDWSDQWTHFAESLPGVGNPPAGEQGNSEEIEQWVDNVVSAFCRENRIYAEFDRTWNSEDYP